MSVRRIARFMIPEKSVSLRTSSPSFHGIGRKNLLRNSSGMVLVLTLMVLAIIFAMVVEFSYEVYVSTVALHSWQISHRLSLLARSGAKLAAKMASERALQHPYTYPGILDISPPDLFEDYKGALSLRLEDENSRFNLKSVVFPNGALNPEARNSLIRLLRALDLNPEIADRIIDWVDLDKEPRLPDSENGAKNRNLDSLDEIFLIPAIAKSDCEKLLPYVTIYGSETVNINGASIPVLMSLSDSVDKGMAERVVRYREILPFEKPADLLKVAGFGTMGQAMMGRIAVQGTTFRIVSTASEGDIKRVIESVIEMPSQNSLIRYWKET
jgi:type II secretory pathway component PulK